MRNRKIKILSVLIIQLIVIAFCTNVFASTMITHNGSLHRLVLKSEKSKDYSSQSQVIGQDNGKGSVGLETVDAAHGTSVVLKAENVASYTSEGPWVQFDGDNSLSLVMYEFELYIGELSGAVKFQVKANGSFYCLDINEDGIGFGDTRTDLAYEQWNKIRILFDRANSNRKMYLYVNDDAPIEFTGGSLWRLGSGIEYMRMILVGATDAYVAADNLKVYSVVEMPEDYVTPSLNLQTEDRITEIESTQIQAVIETDAEIENVAFYVDNSLVYTDAEAPYILEHRFDVGSHTVRAVATDIYGETGEKVITITSLADTRPRIEMEIEDGKEYDRKVLKDTLISVTMSDTDMADGNVFVDGTSVASLAQGDNHVDLSGLSLGVHTVKVYAENILGESTEKSVRITVSKSTDDAIWSADFNDGVVIGQLNGDGQFIRTEVLKPEYKESLLVGANTTQDTTKQGAWMPISLEDTSTVAVVDFDLYFSGINGGGFVVQAMPGWVKLFEITDRGIVVGTQTHPFEAEQWYHVTIEVDAQNSTFSLYLDDELIFNKVEISNIPEAIDSLRAISVLQGTEETYFAIDNIVVRQLTQVASIKEITSENGDANVVLAKDKEIKVYFTSGLKAAGVYPAKFKLPGAVIEKAEYDADNFCVTLTLKNPLSPGEYRLETAENLVMSNGDIYAEKLYGNFEVKDSMVDVQSLSVADNTVTASIINSSQDDKVVYLIINLYTGDVMKSSTVKALTLGSGENSVSEQVEGYVSGDMAEAIIWDSLSIPACLKSTAD